MFLHEPAHVYADQVVLTIEQERRQRLAFRNLPNGLKNLTGLDELTSINLRAVSTMLRDLALSEEGASIATP